MATKSPRGRPAMVVSMDSISVGGHIAVTASGAMICTAPAGPSHTESAEEVDHRTLVSGIGVKQDNLDRSLRLARHPGLRSHIVPKYGCR